MNYTVPPSYDDLQVMARAVLENLPDELQERCGDEDIAIIIEDMVDEAIEQEMGLDNPFDLPVQFKSGKEISPGVEKKTAGEQDTLIIYRRAILDAWCDLGEDLTGLMRQLILEEIGRHFEFSDEDVDEMVQRHYQGML